MSINRYQNAFYSLLLSTLLTSVSVFYLILANPAAAHADNLCSQIFRPFLRPEIHGLSKTLPLEDLLLSPMGQSIWGERWFQNEFRSAIAHDKELRQLFDEHISGMEEIHFSQQSDYAGNFISVFARSDKYTKEAVQEIQKYIYFSLLRLSQEKAISINLIDPLDRDDLNKIKSWYLQSQAGRLEITGLRRQDSVERKREDFAKSYGMKYLSHLTSLPNLAKILQSGEIKPGAETGLTEAEKTKMSKIIPGVATGSMPQVFLQIAFSEPSREVSAFYLNDMIRKNNLYSIPTIIELELSLLDKRSDYLANIGWMWDGDNKRDSAMYSSELNSIKNFVREVAVGRRGQNELIFFRGISIELFLKKILVPYGYKKKVIEYLRKQHVVAPSGKSWRDIIQEMVSLE